MRSHQSLVAEPSPFTDCTVGFSCHLCGQHCACHRAPSCACIPLASFRAGQEGQHPLVSRRPWGSGVRAPDPRRVQPDPAHPHGTRWLGSARGHPRGAQRGLPRLSRATIPCTGGRSNCWALPPLSSQGSPGMLGPSRSCRGSPTSSKPGPHPVRTWVRTHPLCAAPEGLQVGRQLLFNAQRGRSAGLRRPAGPTFSY